MTQAAADDTSTQASPTPRDSHSGSTVHTYIAAAALGTSRPTVATTTGTTSLTASGTASLTASGTAASPTLPSDNRTQSGGNSETTLSGQQPVTVNKSLRLDTSDSDESHVTSSDAAAVDVSAGVDHLSLALPTSTESVIQQDTNSSSAVNSHNMLPGAIQGTDALRTNVSSKTHNSDINDPGGTSYDISSEHNATANDSVPGDWQPVSVLATSTDRHANDLNATHHHDDTSNTGDNEEQRLPVQVSRHSMTSSGVIT